LSIHPIWRPALAWVVAARSATESSSGRWFKQLGVFVRAVLGWHRRRARRAGWAATPAP